MGTATVVVDVALAAVAAGVLAMTYVLTLALHRAARALAPVLPPLPEQDRAPAGLGRLVPVGTQVDSEVRRGLVALEIELAAHRRRPPGRSDRP